MHEWKALAKKLEAYKYLILLLVLGAFLMLFPSQAKKESDGRSATESALEKVLSDTDGVGRIRVAASENGVVVVCDGAGSASVRLEILHAIGSYTGFGSDRITVLKMSEQKGK